jgi:membrane fusion protein (multidrug efflux system)/multidrug efflux system membrane fusion protein
MGSISCPRTLELGFDEAGTISEVLVDEGDTVTEGQVLAKLDSSVLEAEKKATEARLASVAAELRYYENELEKKEALFARNALSDTDLKKAALDVEKARASIEYVRAEIHTAETKLNKRILVAPGPGIIAQKHVEVGSVIMPGSNKVFTLIQCSKAWAEIELGEKLFSSLRIGMHASLKVDALAGRSFDGKVIKISPQIDKKNRTFIAKVEVDNSHGLLRPGMFTRAELSVDKESGPIIIPREALIDIDSSGVGNLLVVKDGVALKRRVLVGKITQNAAEVIKGLTKGELVIISGQDTIKDLDEVTASIIENLPEHK